MSEEDLERDHITVNTTMYCVIPLQLYLQKFIYKPMTTIYHVSREKKNQLTVNEISSLKTIILVLKDRRQSGAHNPGLWAPATVK